VLKALRTFADVDLIALVHDDDEAAHVADLGALATTVTGVRVPKVRNLFRSALALPSSRPLSHTMLDGPDLHPAIARLVAAHRPDVVLAFCTGIAHVVMRPPLSTLPLVLDMVDVDSAKWAALARTSAWPRSWIYEREARLLARFETEIAGRAFATLLTTKRERDTLRAMAPGARIDVVQNGVDAEALRPRGAPSASQSVAFCGVMNYPPNEQGAVWLAREVWPRVRQTWPAATLELVGSSPTPSVKALASPEGGVVVTGHIDDVRPYLWGAAVAAAPLLTARGIQNKVLEAVAAGLPVVVTPVVSEGVPPEVRPACVVADGPEAFAEALVRLLGRAPEERRRLASRADVISISWDRRLAGLQETLAGAIRRQT